MMEMLNRKLEISEEKSIKNTLLYIKNINVNTESYEAKILSEDSIENMIKYQLAYEGENRVLKYDVSNTISLDEYLKFKKLTKKDLCRILFAIDEILLSIENYLLSENSLVLDMKLVRVSKKKNDNISFKFIAIPNYNSCFSYELSKLLIKLLRYVDVEDKEALTLSYGLFVRSSKDNYTMNDLMELVDKVYSKEEDEQINIDELMKYDEEMASEIVEDIEEDDKTSIYEEIEPHDSAISNTIVSNDENSLIIDAKTKGILSESLLDDFDKEDEKIIEANRKPFAFKKKKALKGHISVGIIGYILAPIVVVALPILYYFIYA
ncbi:MAG: hypothetical protein IJP71_01010 [Lachnospiraceae bacterium]|nr:hypothetical protein [Lachnospiraceae bacterium]